MHANNHETTHRKTAVTNKPHFQGGGEHGEAREHASRRRALTEVVPLVAGTAPIIVGGPVVGLEVGVLRLRSTFVRETTAVKTRAE